MDFQDDIKHKHFSISIQALRLWHSNFCSGEKATAESVADAISDNRAELVHLPSTVDLHLPLPSKDCPTCDGSVRVILQVHEANFPNFSTCHYIVISSFICICVWYHLVYCRFLSLIIISCSKDVSSRINPFFFLVGVGWVW